MILDPINSITSPHFYRKVSGQSLFRTFFYVCYIVAVFSVISTVAFKVKIGPMIQETFDWLERSVPAMTYADGRVTSSQPGPLKLQHPKLAEVALMIDTDKVDPVTPQQMEESSVMAYLTSNAFYLRQQNGKLEVYDLTKSPTGMKPLQINGSFFRNAQSVLGRVLYPVALAATFFILLFWKGFTSLVLYTIIALIINSSLRAGLAYASLLNIAVYAQTLMLFLVALTLFLPFGIPGFSLISVAVTAGYIWLAVKQHVEPTPAAA